MLQLVSALAAGLLASIAGAGVAAALVFGLRQAGHLWRPAQGPHGRSKS